ncbi:unnamed protein product [Didymodactylos carnosus]|uniref:Uncharacterized protein n=1 Tax=Didymodactylos carnosus TaxID=1234261 RepID=A0A815M3T7_9BILA|nr:unnamed protein product [Didymodactylos carnosus]CAF1418769.1 unnamed protein product [Didymodactylos carnosus]CAF3779122.1 unnamed protein product [Didymodactylos carnosus]CAF4303132.1 unnamed protein product [Didymodactylos carnosus]
MTNNNRFFNNIDEDDRWSPKFDKSKVKLMHDITERDRRMRTERAPFPTDLNYLDVPEGFRSDDVEVSSHLSTTQPLKTIIVNSNEKFTPKSSQLSVIKISRPQSTALVKSKPSDVISVQTPIGGTIPESLYNAPLRGI